MLGTLTARQHAVLTLFLGVCFMHPVPMPGISFILGIIIAIAGARIALGLGPWVPDRWQNTELPAAPLAKALETAARIARRFETREAAPAAWMSGPSVRILTGGSIAACGLLIMTPFPPPTNFPPAIALMLLSVAILRQRPVILAAGLVALAANVALFGALTVGAGAAAFRFLR